MSADSSLRHAQYLAAQGQTPADFRAFWRNLRHYAYAVQPGGLLAHINARRYCAARARGYAVTPEECRKVAGYGTRAFALLPYEIMPDAAARAALGQRIAAGVGNVYTKYGYNGIGEEWRVDIFDGEHWHNMTPQEWQESWQRWEGQMA